MLSGSVLQSNQRALAISPPLKRRSTVSRNLIIPHSTDLFNLPTPLKKKEKKAHREQSYPGDSTLTK